MTQQKTDCELAQVGGGDAEEAWASVFVAGRAPSEALAQK